jgi:glyoxylase-like metal-dependent hydrolase (beta-lactamase superfamily II)
MPIGIYPAGFGENGSRMRETVGFSRISRFGFVNSYVVEDEGGLTVIDTMIPGSVTAILHGAGEHGLPITRILLTHAHQDHMGSLDKLHEAVPRAEVIISARDARPLAKDLSLDSDEPQDKLRGGFPGAETKPTRTLRDGERVGSLQAIAAPGHTPGHFAFLDTRDGTLFCGDAYSSLGGLATSAKTNWRFPLPAKATWHKPTALASARRLCALEPKRLAPGHGKVIEDPQEAMERAIAKAS